MCFSVASGPAFLMSPIFFSVIYAPYVQCYLILDAPHAADLCSGEIFPSWEPKHGIFYPKGVLSYFSPFTLHIGLQSNIVYWLHARTYDSNPEYILFT